MKALPFLCLAGLLLAGSAAAQEWQTYFNMATFGAGGGSDEGGWLNFECAGDDSGFSTAGEPYIALEVKAGVTLSKKSLGAGPTFWVGDDQSFALPMRLEAGSTTTLAYQYSAATVPEVLHFIAALRGGTSFSATLGNENIASIPLDGSNAALEFIEGCVADGKD
jgi:hypothetical protein